MPYQPGEILLDKYRIEELIGQGAFGEVYRVTHLRLFVPRALKILRRDAPGMGSVELFTDGKKRFEVEARLGAHLNSQSAHPHLLQIHDFYAAEDLLALEMEYASGESLAERLKKAKKEGKTIPILEATQIVLEIASGLAALHTQNIIHRDLKPSNILFDGKGVAKLADLGLVQMPEGSSLRSESSSPPSHPGTRGYMSPEQLNPGSYLTPASDIYGLGVTLLEMLTGKLYLRPGTRAESLRTDIPPHLDALLEQMLAKQPDIRPRDGTEVARLLAIKPKVQQSQNWVVWAASLITTLCIGAVAATGINRFISPQISPQKPLITQVYTAAPTSSLESFPDATQTAENPLIPPTFGIGSIQISKLDGMKMVFVPAGEFSMGSTDEQAVQLCSHLDGTCADETPWHKLFLPDYWIDQTEITNAMYALCVRAKKCILPAKTMVHYNNPSYVNHPVAYVSWRDATNYCAWAGRRLPSEAEWEKAARWKPAQNGGGEALVYPWGDDEPTCSLANFSSNTAKTCVGDTTIVGKYPNGASFYGALDMAGNVWEWVADTYQPYPGNTDKKLKFNTSYRVLRGGSWYNQEANIRSTDRNWSGSDSTNYISGIRCAVSHP